MWLAAIGTQLAIAAMVIGFDVPISNNTDDIAELRADRSYVIALVITAVVAAPLVEETVCRGLVMRSLLSRCRPPFGSVAREQIAVVDQADIVEPDGGRDSD